jgi:hypothetical protein
MLPSPRSRVRAATADGSMRFVNVLLAAAGTLCALAAVAGVLAR